MTTTPIDELREQIDQLARSMEIYLEDHEIDAWVSLFNKALEAREMDVNQAGHWYVGAYIPRDAITNEPRHKCQCGYSSWHKESIIQHIQWKLAELTNPPKTKEES